MYTEVQIQRKLKNFWFDAFRHLVERAYQPDGVPAVLKEMAEIERDYEQKLRQVR